MVIFVVACSENNVKKSNTVTKNEKDDFHKLLLGLEKVEEDHKSDNPEDVFGYYYSILMARTAAVGQDSWVAILKDKQIPLRYKKDLVDEIHETAIRIGYE